MKSGFYELYAAGLGYRPVLDRCGLLPTAALVAERYSERMPGETIIIWDSLRQVVLGSARNGISKLY